MPSGPQILLLRFSSLGDVLLTTPLLRAIKTAHPDSEVSYVTKEEYRCLLEDNPNVDRVLVLRRDEPVTELAARLARESFDYRLDLHGNLRSWVVRHRVRGNWATYPKYRLERWALIRLGLDLYRDRRPVSERYFDAAGDLNLKPDRGAPEFFPTDRDRIEALDLLRDSEPFVLLAPGARQRSKCWPVTHWEELSRLAEARELKTVAVGTTEEEGYLGSFGSLRLFGKRLGLVAAVAERATGVVTNDSGLMHLAWAMGRPLVALFGPTVRQFGFAPHTPLATVLERDLPCRPCSHHGTRECPLGHQRCLRDIRPEEVVSVLERAA